MKTLIRSILVITISTAAFAIDPHVEAVLRSVEGAKGKVEKTEDGQSLKLVDLAVPGSGAHAHRTEDPYDSVFFEHLGHIQTLESLNIIATKFNDDWIPNIAKLTNLKILRFTNNGKLTDAGMEQLAGLKNLESFSFVGTQITGKAYAKFEGFTQLTNVSHRGSSIDDEGLKQLCVHLPNLKSISLAHAKFSDAGAPALAKLTNLKGLEIGTLNATSKTLHSLASLPLEYLQLGEGFTSGDCIPLIQGISTLRRLTLTQAKGLTDEDLKSVARLTQLESLEFNALDLPEERISQLSAFSFLKTLTLAFRPKGYPEEAQAKIKALLPKVEVKFVR